MENDKETGKEKEKPFSSKLTYFERVNNFIISNICFSNFISKVKNSI